MGKSEPLETLLKRADEDQPIEGMEAVRALGRRSEARAREALRRALRKRDLAQSAALAMERSGATEFVADLAAALLSDGEFPYETILAALDALDPRWRGRPEAQDVRRKLRMTGPRQSGPAECGRLLALAYVDPQGALDKVIAAVESRGAWGCLGAAVGAVNDRRLVPALMRSLPAEAAERSLDHLAPAWRSSASRAQAATKYVEQLSSSHSYDREQALIALGRLGTTTSMDAIVAALHDPEATVRAEAVRCLSALMGDQARERLHPALTDPSDEVRAAAARALFPVP